MNDTPHTHHDAHHDAVGVTEIADFLRQLRSLSQRPLPAGGPDQAAQHAAERTAFLARKADLLARITAQHPDLAAPTFPAGAGRADSGPA